MVEIKGRRPKCLVINTAPTFPPPVKITNVISTLHKKGSTLLDSKWPCEPYHSDNSSLYVILPRAVRCISSPNLIIIFGLRFYEDLSQQQEF